MSDIDLRYLSGFDRAMKLIEGEELQTRGAILARLKEYRALLVEASRPPKNNEPNNRSD